MNPAAKLGFAALIFFSLFFQRADGNADKPKMDNPRVKTLFDAMLAGKYKEVSFPKLELSDVPALLERADSTMGLASFPINPRSSTVVLECREGIMAMWLIDGIRKGGKFPALTTRYSKNGANPKDDKEAVDIQAEMAKAYRAWWQRAKNLPIPEAMAIEPLKDTGISWR